MATIQENIKNGKIISFKFKAYAGRDENNKQVFRCMTWYPQPEMTATKSKKAAQTAADKFEQEVKEKFKQEQETESTQSSELSDYTFDRFVNDIWIPNCVNDGSIRNTTITFYTNRLKVIIPKFQNIPLNQITSMKIMEFLSWLRCVYRTSRGKPLSDKSIKHYHNILRVIFNYAERQDIITVNPMKKVDTPKVAQKPINALTENETIVFLSELSKRPLDFRCMLYLLLTTGIRRGECVGLQWRDIDFTNSILSVERAVSYTSEHGIMVAAPKTVNSIRKIPIIIDTLTILKEWRQEMINLYPHTNIDNAFVFGSPSNHFQARTPDSLTRRVKRFVKSTGLPDMSPHDLRHTCGSLLISNGADIKSVQEILGHADAATTLNFYVKSDINQMRTATNKLSAVLSYGKGA